MKARPASATYVKGLRDGKEKTVFIYNVADHKDAYNEVGSQGISYTAGVPPVAAAMLVATGEWDVKKMAKCRGTRPQALHQPPERHGPAHPHPGRRWRPRAGFLLIAHGPGGNAARL
jgi:hypothetical protein